MVRDATLNDIPWLMQLAKQMWSESRYRHMAWSDNKIRHLFVELITNDRGIVLVTDHGVLAGYVTEYWFGPDCYATECGVYVEPEHRGKSDGIRLIKAYIERAKQLGAREIHIENSTGINTERTERLFEQLGFSRVGGNFILEVN